MRPKILTILFFNIIVAKGNRNMQTIELSWEGMYNPDPFYMKLMGQYRFNEAKGLFISERNPALVIMPVDETGSNWRLNLGNNQGYLLILFYTGKSLINRNRVMLVKNDRYEAVPSIVVQYFTQRGATRKGRHHTLARSRPMIFQDPDHSKQEQSWWTDIGTHSVSSSLSRQSPYYKTYQHHSNQLDMAGFALHTGKIQASDFNPEDINSGVFRYPLNLRKGPICPALYYPVCGKDGVTYSNLCHAGENLIKCSGECPCSGGQQGTSLLLSSSGGQQDSLSAIESSINEVNSQLSEVTSLLSSVDSSSPEYNSLATIKSSLEILSTALSSYLSSLQNEKPRVKREADCAMAKNYFGFIQIAQRSIISAQFAVQALKTKTENAAILAFIDNIELFLSYMASLAEAILTQLESKCAVTRPITNQGPICPAVYSPVCGQDGKTYANSCFAQNVDVECDRRCPCKDSVICSQEYDPVCGKDGVTYSNLCHAGENLIKCSGECPCSGEQQGCKTVSGPVKDTLCVFPFTYKGNEYRECTTADHDGKLWCATKTDEDANYVDGQWGDCGDSCIESLLQNDWEALAKGTTIRYFSPDKYISPQDLDPEKIWLMGEDIKCSVEDGGKKVTITVPASFHTDKRFKIFTHGFSSTVKSGETAFVDAWMSSSGKSVSVILVDWSVLATPMAYENMENYVYDYAARNSIDVGEFLGKCLAELSNKFDIPGMQIHLVGHSLGSHLMGKAGRSFQQHQKNHELIGRLSGLDPAGPRFVDGPYLEAIPELKRNILTKESARFVDVIHTHGGFKPCVVCTKIKLGTILQLGHMDFYPSGGSVQPGCVFGFDARPFGVCSHGRAVKYYLHSILEPQLFPAETCATVEDCNNQVVDAKGTAYMGETAPLYYNNERKMFYLSIQDRRWTFYKHCRILCFGVP